MLITLATVKQQLRRMDSLDDENIARATYAAVRAVERYLKIPDDTYLVDDTGESEMPDDIGQATLICAQKIIEHPDEDPICPAVVSLLMRRRHMALA